MSYQKACGGQDAITEELAICRCGGIITEMLLIKVVTILVNRILSTLQP